jgi:hypothetical protein
MALPWWVAPVDGQIYIPAVAGDAIYVRTQHGQRILVDTGNDAPQLLEFIGRYTPFWQKNVVDYVLLTQSGASWQGGLAAVVVRGVSRQIIWLPATHADATQVCATTTTPCQLAQIGQHWQIDDVTITVDSSNTLWLRWLYGAIYIAQGSTTAQLNARTHSPPCPVVFCMMVYPWQITPPWQLQRMLHPAGIIYSTGQVQEPPARLSLADRRIAHEWLLHEQLNGAVFIDMHNPTRITHTAPEE